MLTHFWKVRRPLTVISGACIDVYLSLFNSNWHVSVQHALPHSVTHELDSHWTHSHFLARGTLGIWVLLHEFLFKYHFAWILQYIYYTFLVYITCGFCIESQLFTPNSNVKNINKSHFKKIYYGSKEQNKQFQWQVFTVSLSCDFIFWPTILHLNKRFIKIWLLMCPWRSNQMEYDIGYVKHDK